MHSVILHLNFISFLSRTYLHLSSFSSTWSLQVTVSSAIIVVHLDFCPNSSVSLSQNGLPFTLNSCHTNSRLSYSSPTCLIFFWHTSHSTHAMPDFLIRNQTSSVGKAASLELLFTSPSPLSKYLICSSISWHETCSVLTNIWFCPSVYLPLLFHLTLLYSYCS